MTETCGELLVKLLESYGADTVFGIPGVHTIELYRELSRGSIRHVTPRHEQGGGFMADGYARSTGKVGVVLSITGPGLTNLATALGQSYADSVPILAISSVNQRKALGMGHGHLHEMKNQREMLSGVTSFSHTLLNAADLPEVMARAFSVLKAERPRPVHIEIPIDILRDPVGVQQSTYTPPRRPGPDEETIAEIAARLASAKRLVILAGGGVADAPAELTRLSDLTGAPTCLTINARGLLPPTHPLLLDGIQPTDPFRDYVESCDVVLAVGTELGETDYDFYGKGPLKFGGDLIRIDIDPRQLTSNAIPALALVSDSALALTAIADALERRGIARIQQDGAAQTRRINEEARRGYAAATEQYRALLATILDALPDAIIVGDSTKAVYHANFVYRGRSPRRWFNSVTGFGTLGYALPAALGAKVANPDLPVVAIAGDGGFQFTLNELMTARQEGLPIAIIVWNNSSYREIKDAMERAKVNPIGVDVETPNLSNLAAAMGAGYAKPDRIADIGDALKDLAERQSPMIIEFVADHDA